MQGRFENAHYPKADQIAALQAGDTGAIVMVNLLKFRERALYKDGRASTLSGREAYMIYGEAVTRLLPDHGARLLFAGDVAMLTIGQADPLWDDVALAWYPSRRALIEMSMSPKFADIAVHREAGLEGQLNIETKPGFLPPGFLK